MTRNWGVMNSAAPRSVEDELARYGETLEFVCRFIHSREEVVLAWTKKEAPSKPIKSVSLVCKMRDVAPPLKQHSEMLDNRVFELRLPLKGHRDIDIAHRLLTPHHAAEEPCLLNKLGIVRIIIEHLDAFEEAFENEICFSDRRPGNRLTGQQAATCVGQLDVELRRVRVSGECDVASIKEFLKEN